MNVDLDDTGDLNVKVKSIQRLLLAFLSEVTLSTYFMASFFLGSRGYDNTKN